MNAACRCTSNGGPLHTNHTLTGVALGASRWKGRDELLEAQKLKAIGQLAAGIAHEVNTPTHFARSWRTHPQAYRSEQGPRPCG